MGVKQRMDIGEMMEYVKAGPNRCVAFGHGPKDYNLRECLMFVSDSFKNWESGECRLELLTNATAHM